MYPEGSKYTHQSAGVLLAKKRIRDEGEAKPHLKARAGRRGRTVVGAAVGEWIGGDCALGPEPCAVRGGALGRQGRRISAGLEGPPPPETKKKLRKTKKTKKTKKN